MLLPNVHYYFCGPAALNTPAQIEAAIVRACIVAGMMPKEKAKSLVAKMKSEKRWRVESF